MYWTLRVSNNNLSLSRHVHEWLCVFVLSYIHIIKQLFNEIQAPSFSLTNWKMYLFCESWSIEPFNNLINVNCVTVLNFFPAAPQTSFFLDWPWWWPALTSECSIVRGYSHLRASLKKILSSNYTLFIGSSCLLTAGISSHHHHSRWKKKHFLTSFRVQGQPRKVIIFLERDAAAAPRILIGLPLPSPASLGRRRRLPRSIINSYRMLEIVSIAKKHRFDGLIKYSAQ